MEQESDRENKLKQKLKVNLKSIEKYKIKII